MLERANEEERHRKRKPNNDDNKKHFSFSTDMRCLYITKIQKAVEEVGNGGGSVVVAIRLSIHPSKIPKNVH